MSYEDVVRSVNHRQRYWFVLGQPIASRETLVNGSRLERRSLSCGPPQPGSKVPPVNKPLRQFYLARSNLRKVCVEGSQ